MNPHYLRPMAVMLCFLLIMAVPARAGSIGLTDVVQAIVDGQNGRPRVELRMRAVSQNGQRPIASGSSTSADHHHQSGSSDGNSSIAHVRPANILMTESNTIGLQDGAILVRTIDLGDITGTVCDCGEILVPPGGGAGGAGFPGWLLLGGLPLVCLTGVCTSSGTDEECVVNCTPTATTSVPVPEPATLLLFGTGMMALGAGIRRRRHARREALAAVPAEEV